MKGMQALDKETKFWVLGNVGLSHSEQFQECWDQEPSLQKVRLQVPSVF